MLAPARACLRGGHPQDRERGRTTAALAKARRVNCIQRPRVSRKASLQFGHSNKIVTSGNLTRRL
eukprot:4167932-Pleurochrysis_carterae.AAC.1